LTAAGGLDNLAALGIDTRVPSGNQPAPDKAADGATTGARAMKTGGTMVATPPPAGFVPPGETIDTAATQSARLAVLTEPLAGHEFVLDGDCCFIGRAEDNDIVLDHESVSRRHAKVVRAGDRYVVVDLQSANGVRVNGIEQSQVEVHAGDLITLGLVCVRFAGAAEPASHAREFSPALSRGRRILALTAMLGVPAAIIISVVVGQRSAPRGPATAVLPTPMIEDFTHIRERGPGTPAWSPVGAALPPAAGWSALQPSAGRSIKSAASVPGKQWAGRRHSAAPARDMEQPAELPTAAPAAAPRDRDDPTPPPSPRRRGGGSAHTIDTEDPYPADR
jgi:predicted component of type VI protein secretion system